MGSGARARNKHIQKTTLDAPPCSMDQIHRQSVEGPQIVPHVVNTFYLISRRCSVQNVTRSNKF